MFVSLFAGLRAPRSSPIVWHRAQGAFVRKSVTAEGNVVVMCLLGRSWFREGNGAKGREKKNREELTNAEVE